MGCNYQLLLIGAVTTQGVGGNFWSLGMDGYLNTIISRVSYLLVLIPTLVSAPKT